MYFGFYLRNLNPKKCYLERSWIFEKQMVASFFFSFDVIIEIGDRMKKYGKYIGVFLFSMILLCLVPIAGDDWGNYLAGKNGFIYAFTHAYELYFTWEGRFVSRVLVTIFAQYKWLWNVINSLLITWTIYMCMKFVGEKPKKVIFPLMCLVFLGMNLFTFSQIIPWITGNITYFVVVPILLWYFYYLINNDEYSNWRMGLFILINVLCTMFIENMAAVLVGGNILVLIYKYFKNKKIDKRVIVYIIISSLSMLVMMISPGTALRSKTENVVFNELNLLGKIEYNLPNFVNYTFISNPFLLMLLAISSWFIIRKSFKNKWIRILMSIFMISGPVVGIILYPISLFATKTLFLVDPTKVYVIIYWLVYLISFAYLLWVHNKSELVNIFLLLLGLCSNGAMMLSPTWGYRTSFFTYLMFCIVALRIINVYIKERKMVEYFSYTLLGCGCLFYLVFYINVSRCQIDLEISIKKQLNDNSEIVYINSFPSFVNCNINPTNDYHMSSFKKYYGIADEKSVVIKNSNWKYGIFYKG